MEFNGIFIPDANIVITHNQFHICKAWTYLTVCRELYATPLKGVLKAYVVGTSL